MAKSKAKTETAEKPADGGWRETVESIAMAVILALLFRGFVAEAFVIPTGSMAPTLMGRHKDVWCPKCGYQYQASASDERRSDTDSPNGHHVVGTMCPLCRYPQWLDLFNDPNEHSFSGDRIIVGKFSYDLAEPQRWDVIVFKFPGKAVQNYIKRLIGLPNERVLIAGGNIYTAELGAPDEALQIARKPPHKLEALLQLVDDTDFIPPDLVQVGWPSRWQEQRTSAWQPEEGGKAFVIAGENAEDAILRYRHLFPSVEDWREIAIQQQLPAGASERAGQLITDFYAYNAFYSVEQSGSTSPEKYLTPQNYDPRTYDPDKVNEPGPGIPLNRQVYVGMHWVDDLAVECLAEIDGNAGEVILQSVRAGVTYECRIDVATGEASLTCRGASGEVHEFVSDDGATLATTVKAQTAVKGPGKYRLKLSNCDHEVLLWVNGSVVKFDGPTTYPSPRVVRPFWSPENPGDLAPLGVGTRGVAARLSQLRVYRDKYYIATETTDYLLGKSPDEVLQLFADPAQWETSNLFDEEYRQEMAIQLEADQFLPMGDNSPQSYDGRFWKDPLTNKMHRFVERDLLIGKALMIYWPHTWNRPVPFFPNFRKMQLIH